jgi:hypothetical protein
MKRNRCICGFLKSGQSKTCMKCDSIRKSNNYKGNKNPNWKGNKRKKLPKCIDCGHNLGNFNKDRRRCRKCYFKYFKIIISQSLSFKNKLKKFFEGRKNPDQSKRMIGKNNPMFNNWSSKEPYTLNWTNQIRESIRERDNYTCQKCNKIQKQELKDLNRKLSIHHIDYNKQNCKEDNLITLCLRCHLKTNLNRDYWFSYFTYIMENSIYDTKN